MIRKTLLTMTATAALAMPAVAQDNSMGDTDQNGATGEMGQSGAMDGMGQSGDTGGMGQDSTMGGMDQSGSMGEADIVETASSAGNFSTLTAAVEQAGLTETLTGEGPFTVFAPTDQAFEQVDSGTLDELMMDENQDELESVLTYHVVPESVMASDLSDGQTIETVNGETLEVSIDGDTVMINDATVTQSDLEASNGVIHVIDGVLMPDDGM